MRRGLLDRYSSGVLVEERFLLSDIAELAAEDGITAVSRLIILPSFQPEAIVTVSFGSIGLKVESVKAESSLFDAAPIPEEPLPDPDGDPEGDSEPAVDMQTVVHERGFVLSASAPPPFDSSANFAEAAAAAPSIPFVRPGPDGIMSATADGVSYVHRFVSGSNRLDAEWPNPMHATDPAQCEIVDAYRKLIACAGIKDETLADQ